MKHTVLALAVVAPLLVGACYGDDKPPTSQIERGISTSNERGLGIAFSDGQGRCLAELYRDSDLSSQYLESLAKGTPSPTRDDLDELADLSAEALRECPPEGN